MATKKLSAKYLAFCIAIAGGEDQATAYKDQISKGNCSQQTAEVNSSKLMARPEVRAKVEEFKEKREAALVKQNIETLPPEFTGIALTVEQLDQLHYSIAKGLVEVEEVVPVKKVTKDTKGKVVEETVSFVKVKRKANIRERQASVDALYKRFGHYAPSKGLFAVGKLADEDEEQNVERFFMLSNGEKLPF